MDDFFTSVEWRQKRPCLRASVSSARNSLARLHIASSSVRSLLILSKSGSLTDVGLCKFSTPVRLRLIARFPSVWRHPHVTAGVAPPLKMVGTIPSELGYYDLPQCAALWAGIVSRFMGVVSIGGPLVRHVACQL